MTLVKIIRMTTETLQGIPSIVFGLFGFLAFAVACRFSYSLLGGAITMALMVLPLIMRTTEEALLSVPDSFREGSFGLGRRTAAYHLPHHSPQRCAGHPGWRDPRHRAYRGRDCGADVHRRHIHRRLHRLSETLPHAGGAYVPAAVRGQVYGAAYATAVVLLVMVILINALSGYAAKKLTKK